MTEGTDGAFDLELTCTPAVEGCMNDVACNYDSTANVPGDCDFTSCACPEGSTGTGLVFEATDSWGDGFNGATYTVTNGAGDVVVTGAMGCDQTFCAPEDVANDFIYSEDTDNNVGLNFGLSTMCLEDGCYTMTVGRGSWDGDISWTLSSATTLITSGGGASVLVADFTIGDAVCGCTVQASCNYNADANSDDGSCEYDSCSGCLVDTYCNYDASAILDDGSCCSDNCVTINMNDSYGDGWSDYQDSAFSYVLSTIDGVEVATGTLEDGSFGSDLRCLADGCYFFEIVGDAFDGTEVSWSINGAAGALPAGGVGDSAIFSVGDITDGAFCVTGCMAECACNFNTDANIEDNTLCVFEGCDPVVGCTYESASNYDSTSGLDDGTCVFELVNPCPADLNGDGSITTGDLLIFLGAFGSICD